MLLSRAGRIAAACVLFVSLIGCGDRTKVDPPSVQRLAQELLSTAGDALAEAPVFDTSWNVSGARTAHASADGLQLAWGGSPATLRLGGRIRAEDYPVFEVRMRITRTDGSPDLGSASTAVLRWTGNLDPYPRPENELSVQVFPDGDLHTYRFRLWSPDGNSWLGEINQLEFVPCDVAADIEIVKMELVNEPSTAPLRLTVEQETHEALYGTQEPWRISVPQNAMFETYVGLDRLSWLRDSADGVQFSVQLEDSSGAVTEIAGDSFNPLQNEADRVWRMLQADLSAYAGQMVTLRLTVDTRENSRGDYAYWGSPIIYERSDAEDAVPVIFISCDTLRADHLSCYGYERETSPNLDMFRKDAVLFENAMCTVAWTLPSHVSMFTGLYPKNHGVTRTTYMPEQIETLAEKLGGAGYLTAAYTGVEGYLSTIYGFSHGFDVYNTPNLYRDVEDTLALTHAWLDKHQRDSFFLFMHNFDIHAKSSDDSEGASDLFAKLPYHPPRADQVHFAKGLPVPLPLQFKDSRIPTGARFLELGTFGKMKFDEDVIEYLVALYDDGIRYVDSELEKLFDSLKERGLYDKALIVVTSDHGEEFGEHDSYSHTQIYQETHHVPLLIKFPEGKYAGDSVSSVVSLTDLYPTILDVVGVEAPPGLDGESLIGLIEGTATPRDKAYGYIRSQWAVRTGDWHMVSDEAKGQTELFDFPNDPLESNDIAAKHPDEVEELRTDLLDFFAIDGQGWNIAFSSVAEHGGSRFEWSAVFEKPVAQVEFEQAEDHAEGNLDTYEVSPDSLSVTASTMLWMVDWDRMVIRTTEGGERMQLNIAANRPVDIVIGNGTPLRLNQHQILLDPEEMEYPKPDIASAPPGDVPRVVIWYEPPTMALPATQTLSDEEKEQLEAMGYLQ